MRRRYDVACRVGKDFLVNATFNENTGKLQHMPVNRVSANRLYYIDANRN